MTFDKIRDIIAETLDIDAETIKPESTFEEDLDADSLDVIQVITEIEDEFDVTFDTDEEFTTIQDVVDFVEKEQA